MRGLLSLIGLLLITSVSVSAQAGFSDTSLKQMSEVQRKSLLDGEPFTLENARLVWDLLDQEVLKWLNEDGISNVPDLDMQGALQKFKAAEKEDVIQLGSVQITFYQIKPELIAANYYFGMGVQPVSTVHLFKKDSGGFTLSSSYEQSHFGVEHLDYQWGVIQIGEFKGCMATYHTPPPQMGGAVARAGIYWSDCDPLKAKYFKEDVDNPKAKPKKL